jgi:hypothetical protein
MTNSCEPFLGSEALASRALNRHQLRSRFSAIYPDVYLAKDAQPTLRRRITGAWLWSARRGIVAGFAAAAMHGTKWIDDDTPIELIHANPRAPNGVITRRVSLLEGEYERCGAIICTTAARTGFDIGSRARGRLATTVAHLDALVHATKVTTVAVAEVAGRHPGSPGLRQLEAALALVDGGAASPRETWLRLLLIGDGLPAPTTQIAVVRDGRAIAYLDMGWEELMVAVEYDGDQHRTDRAQYVKDIRRIELLERMGWIIVRVVAEDRPADILRRVRDAIARRSSIVH